MKRGGLVFLQVQGVKLHYEIYGHSGPQILLLHGWGCSVKHFEPIIRALENEYRLCVIDFPAHGDSDRPPVPWGVGEFCACVQEFLQGIQFVPCNIIAHSFGGRVALMLAAKQPQLVQKMILTGCAGLRGEKSPEQTKREAAFKKKKALLLSIAKIPVFEKLSQKVLRAMQQNLY